MGSCFADNIGDRLRIAGFDCLRNPFGTLYNPASIARAMTIALSWHGMEKIAKDVFESNGLWHSWMHHSRFSADSRQKLLDNIGVSLNSIEERLSELDVLIVTFGSAFVYRLKETGDIVANCHKQNENLFDRGRLQIQEIVNQWTELIARLKEINPKMRIIFTVSPIRHKRDGLHENQLSKSTLLMAIDEICANDSSMCLYFPSYEIMMDELRDYRFYADDMVHPSSLAVEIIWERFVETYMSKQTKLISAECRKVMAALSHRPFNPDGAEYAKFRASVMEKIQKLKKDYGVVIDENTDN